MFACERRPFENVQGRTCDTSIHDICYGMFDQKVFQTNVKNCSLGADISFREIVGVLFLFQKRYKYSTGNFDLVFCKLLTVIFIR